jgi:hypothetical protein
VSSAGGAGKEAAIPRDAAPAMCRRSRPGGPPFNGNEAGQALPTLAIFAPAAYPLGFRLTADTILPGKSEGTPVTKDHIKKLIEALVTKYEADFSPPIERLSQAARGEPPNREDWTFLERKFHCSFSPEFVAFAELIVDYNLPGMMRVRREGDSASGDPTIDWWYDHEMSFGSWNPDMIPFIGVGNGDFFCLSVADGPQSGVYYADHEAGEEQRLTASFQEWLERLEEFLQG